VRQKRFVFGGSLGESDDVIEGDQLGWTRIARTTPPPTVTACAFEEPRDRLICVNDTSPGSLLETWAWSGTWSKLPASGGDASPNALAYDPMRKAIVGVGFSGLVQLSGDTWVTVTQAAPLQQPASSLVFDPVRKVLVAVLTSQFGGVIWLAVIHADNSVDAVPSAYFSGLAFDARNSVVVASGNQGSTVELHDRTWVPVVGPGIGYTAVTNDRRGTVEFVTTDRSGVERIGSTFQLIGQRPPLPVRGSLAIVQSTGELLVYGADVYSRFLLHRRWISSTPFESCSAGDDVDGDGLEECADPDCWTRCAPTCPPLATCP
jgi:hypothetical protein